MFRGNRGRGPSVLPMAGSNGPLGYNSRSSTSGASLSKSFIASVGWVIISSALVIYGYTYCRSRMETTSLDCDHAGCKLKTLHGGVKGVLYILRENLVRAEVVRTKDNQIVQPTGMRRQEQRRLGHSYALVIREPDSEDDDDDSYDSFEDDDDSYDSYDDSEDSSESVDDDDDSEDLNPPRPQAYKPRATSQNGPGYSAEAAARAARYRDQPGGKTVASEERFPGDAGTAPDGRPQHHIDRDAHFREGMERHQSKMAVHAHSARVGNNLHDDRESRKVESRGQRREPGDEPKDNIEDFHHKGHEFDKRDAQDWRKEPGVRPVGERVKEEDKAGVRAESEAVPGTNSDQYDGELDKETQIKNLEMKLAHEKHILDLQQQLADARAGREVRGGGGGERGLNSVGVIEDYESADSVGVAEELEERTGGGRKLMAWRDNVAGNSNQQRRYKNAGRKTGPSEQVIQDAAREREAHRNYHGHHLHKKVKAGHEEVDEEELNEGKHHHHHHHAFHHNNTDPNQPSGPGTHSHHHQSFHHKPGDEKVPHGWRHQNRQWHSHQQHTVLATPFSMSRSNARSRMDAINNYVFKRATGPNKDSVHLHDTKRWRARGLWIMILGGISLVFSLMIGNFQPRAKGKKSS